MLKNQFITNKHRCEDKGHAIIFAALSDETRLHLIAQLRDGSARSIAQLAAGLPLSRQAITKHLRILETANILRCIKVGRESLFEFNPTALSAAQEYLTVVSKQWDQSLSRLKAFVESPSIKKRK